MCCVCPAVFVNVITRTGNCVKCIRYWEIAWFYLDNDKRCFDVILSPTHLILTTIPSSKATFEFRGI